jgi:hypothetical protein
LTDEPDDPLTLPTYNTDPLKEGETPIQSLEQISPFIFGDDSDKTAELFLTATVGDVVINDEALEAGDRSDRLLPQSDFVGLFAVAITLVFFSFLQKLFLHRQQYSTPI